MGFGRSSVHKILLEGSGDCSSIPSSMAKNLGEAFAAKSMFVDFTEVVIIPQLVVDGMEGGEKLLEGWDTQVLQGINSKEFREGFAYIPIVIPKRVI